MKISIADIAEQRWVVVEGSLVSPWIEDVKTACEWAKRTLGDRGFFVEVTNLTAISQEGENLLLKLRREGVQVRCGCGALTHYVLCELVRRRTLMERKNGSPRHH